MGTRIGGFIGFSTSTTNLGASGIWDSDSQSYFIRQGIDRWTAGEAYGPIVATGGVVTVPGNGYKYHFFTATGPFNVVSGFGSIDTYLVAGGGAGGFSPGGAGGAGAGGMRTVPNLGVSVGDYTVQCGAGAAGASSQTLLASNGSPSKITSALGVLVVEAQGGGAGGTASDPVYGGAGKPGGSGGGGNYGTPPNPGGLGNRDPNNNPVPPQGNNGGTGYPTGPNYGGGGGGGAGGVGGNGNNNGGAGGVGAAFADPVINSLPQYGTPGPAAPMRYFAGGGGGGAYTSGGGTGGYGGGGNGGPPTSQPDEDRSGEANTGGGGGGMGHQNVGASGPLKPAGNGGSGFVCIRYQI